MPGPGRVLRAARAQHPSAYRSPPPPRSPPAKRAAGAQPPSRDQRDGAAGAPQQERVGDGAGPEGVRDRRIGHADAPHALFRAPCRGSWPAALPRFLRRLRSTGSHLSKQRERLEIAHGSLGAWDGPSQRPFSRRRDGRRPRPAREPSAAAHGRRRPPLPGQLRGSCAVRRLKWRRELRRGLYAT